MVQDPYGPQAFADRREAGEQLAAALHVYADQDPLVLALPRGGVPVAYAVAAGLRAPLDLLLVRKIGAPGHAELGLGAVVDGDPPQRVMNPELEDLAPPAYVEAQVQRELKEIARRRRVYLGARAPLAVAGRTVLLIDDGVATGGTARAALKGLEKAGARRLILGLPVGPPDVVASLEAEADAVVCLLTPTPFYAVGLWYRDFDQTSDREVIDLLTKARAAAEGRRGPDPRGADKRTPQPRP